MNHQLCYLLDGVVIFIIIIIIIIILATHCPHPDLETSSFQCVLAIAFCKLLAADHPFISVGQDQARLLPSSAVMPHRFHWHASGILLVEATQAANLRAYSVDCLHDSSISTPLKRASPSLDDICQASPSALSLLLLSPPHPILHCSCDHCGLKRYTGHNGHPDS